VVLSDDAGQFDIGRHAPCWVHAERLVHKLDTFTDLQRAAQQRVRKLRRLTALLGISPLRGLIWNFYADLKIYRANPSKSRRLVLRARFDRIFRRRTGFVTLDRLLKRLHANKAELLMVLERPEIPLHTNGSENDIRCQVTRRKVSAGTRSDAGRDCLPRPGQDLRQARCGVLGLSWQPTQSARAACRSAPGGPCPLPRATGLIPTAGRRFAGVTCKTTNLLTGGAEGNRTPDLLNAIQALSQLSYGPDRLVYSHVIPLDQGPAVLNAIESQP
jgi:hypothetical protein